MDREKLILAYGMAVAIAITRRCPTTAALYAHPEEYEITAKQSLVTCPDCLGKIGCAA